MGDGTKEKPYTREDVLRLIHENGDKAEGLNLSGKYFEEGIDLHELNLEGGVFADAHLEEAYLSHAHLEGANLSKAHLEGAKLYDTHLEKADLYETHLEGARLWDTYLKGAKLWDTYLKGARLGNAHLEGADLTNTKLPSDFNLEDVDWGNYILNEEKSLKFDIAADTYRRLKQWYTNSGMYDTAGKFFYREKEAERRAANRRLDRITGWLSWAFFGHGEGWKRILLWIAGIVVLFAFVYFTIATFAPGLGKLDPNSSFLDYLYFSAVSFIAVGYGSWITQASGLIRILGVVETFIGFFMMTLSLVVFVRKWTR